MADTYAKVTRANYIFRGHKIPVGTVLKVTDDQLEAASTKNPPYFEKTAAPKKGTPFVDLTAGLKMAQAELETKK